MKRQFLLLALLRFTKLGISLSLLMISAREFGVGTAMDAWVFASGVVAAAGMFSWGPVNEIVRSRFLSQVARTSVSESAKTATQLMRVTALGSAMLALTLWFAGPWLLSLLYTSVSTESDQLLGRLFALLLPSLVLGQILALGSAYLNCCDVIYAPEWIGIIAALASLACVAVLAPLLGIYALAVAQYAGLIFSVIGVLALLWRRRFLGAPWRPWAGPMVRDYLYFSAPLFLSYGAGQANGLFEKTLASSLGPGMVSSVNYASQIKSTLQAVVSSVLFSLAVPRLSQAVAGGGGSHEFTIAWRDVQRVVLLFLLVVLPPFWGAANLISALLLGSGRVAAEHIELLTELIRLYSLTLIPVALYLVHGAALLAQQKGRSYAFWGVAAQALSACCCLLLVHRLGPKVFPFALLFSHGVAAIAMARAVAPSRVLWLDLLGWLGVMALACASVRAFVGWAYLQAGSALLAFAFVCVAYGLVVSAGFVGARALRKRHT